MLKRYFLYLIRWQLSTPILAIFVALFVASLGATWTTILANFVGGLIFFWVDIWIFKNTDVLYSGELWEVKNDIECSDCNIKCRGYRLVKHGKYDKSKDKNPEFRCHDCSRKKYDNIKQKHKENAS